MQLLTLVANGRLNGCDNVGPIGICSDWRWSSLSSHIISIDLPEL